MSVNIDSPVCTWFSNMINDYVSQNMISVMLVLSSAAHVSYRLSSSIIFYNFYYLWSSSFSWRQNTSGYSSLVYLYTV